MTKRLAVLAGAAIAIAGSSTVIPGAQAAGPQVLTAPGRLAVALSPTRVADIDQAGASDAVETGIDGSVVAIVPGAHGQASTLVGLRPDGRLRKDFGRGGVVRFSLPAGAGRFYPAQVLRDGAGRLLVVGATSDQAPSTTARIAVLRLMPGGAVDERYGTGGFVQLTATVGGRFPADVAPDGSVVLGTRGAASGPAQEWDVVRLDPSGHLAQGFGTAGTVRVPASGAGGAAARFLADGRVLTVASTNAVASGGFATRLLADGRVDASYHGGQPAAIPFAQDLAVRPDGRLDVLQAILAPQVVVRLTAGGERDGAFGTNGAAAVDSSMQFGRLLPRPDGSDLVWAGNPQPGFASRRDLALQDLTADGRTQSLRETSIPFVAGPTSFVAVGSTDPQHGLQAGALLLRPDGGLLVLGGAPVRRYTGEGSGFSTVPLAEARLRPDDALDLTFGGPLARATAATSLMPQRARTAARTRRIRVRLRTSGPGTAILRVRDSRRSILAEDVTAVAGRTTTTAQIRLTRDGRRLLVAHHQIRVTVGVDFRDVVGARAGALARGTLR